MTDAAASRTKPAIRGPNDRAFRILMRKVGWFPPLSMSANYVLGLIVWFVFRIALVFVPSRIEERLLWWNWEGMVAPWFFITILPMVTYAHRSRFHFMVHKDGSSVLAKKHWWQRLSGRHVIFELDPAKTAALELRDGESWWQSATMRIGEVNYAPIMQRSAVKRFRAMLANPGGPIPPLY